MSGLDLARLTRDYGDPLAEARACRDDCALFDFSFVARAVVEGPDAPSLIATLTRRPMADLKPGRIRYAVREDAQGVLVSDLTIWRHGDGSFEVMSGRGADIADLVRDGHDRAAVRDLSHQTAIFAVQGPRTLEALAGLTDPHAIARLGYYGHCRTRVADIPCLVGRLGYTGEPGVEILLPEAHGSGLWRALAAHARPAGFAAAEILRIEAGFVLFANEFRLPVRAREAGLTRFAADQTPPGEDDVRLICFRAETAERPVLWRPADDPERPSARGSLLVTSACHSPLAGGTLGLGYALARDVAEGAALSDPSGTFRKIEPVALPFYDPGKKRPRADWAAARG